MNSVPSGKSISSEISAAFTKIDSNIDLTNCEREPIHTPNLIQPHGVLLAVSLDEYQILQVSLNTTEILGIEPKKLLDKPLQDLLGKEQIETIKGCLAENFDNINPIPIKITKPARSLKSSTARSPKPIDNEESLAETQEITTFSGIVHLQGDIIIIELESSQFEPNRNFFDFYKLVKSPIDRLQNTKTLEQLGNAIAREVKKITGFDRVMVYRFDSGGAGTVVAEAVETELQPYLGLHYPATDIPQRAKHLFTLKPLRLIPDVTYEPVGITPQLNPLTDKLLDMSMTELRSVSPFHIEYLNNMGVGATLVISLVKNKQLWGLISCHHNTPKKISYEIRTACEFIGQIASFELAAKQSERDLDYKMKLKSMQSQLVETIAATDDLEMGLAEDPQQILDLVGAKGVALSLGREIVTLGNTPDRQFIEQMLPWLSTQFNEDVVFQTNSLGEVYPAAEKHKATASGILALLISRVQKTCIIWFRPEVVQTINWAGNPNQPVDRNEAGILLLSPRTSFSLWQETVEGTSIPWKSCEIEAAIELRSSIISIVLRKADELSQINKELTRSNTELDAFAYIASHDLKEPLRGIYNYSSFLIEDYGEVLDESGIDKLNTLMQLTHRMEDLINSLLRYSRLGRAELQLRSSNMNDLVGDVLRVIEVSARDSKVKFEIPRSLPSLKCDRTQVNELFTNLISNGIKYNQQEQKIIEIGYLDPDDPIAIAKMLEYPDNTPAKTIFYVRDNGIGIQERHLEKIFRIFKRLHGQKKYGGGTGAGLTIAKKIVERHGGEIWVKSTYKQGTTFYFTLK